ncbi:MAG: hypothetical protein JNL97_13800 [Verrucomicrobiales bacterium]|nr:hypothetical protein [Verrucomicrobiales bacterium]
MPTRREFLGSLAAAAVAAGQPRALAASPRPKRVALVTTVWTYLSHAQHMGDRFLVGYPRDGRWHPPGVRIVSAYVDQKPAGDLSGRRAAEHGLTVYPTIAEALRCGGDRLAVDGVVIIGEHGEYPRNAKGQVLYPRYEFFREVVRVFEQDGRVVPVFNDKHLSYSWEKARDMVALAKRLKIPFLAGSSLPVTWRLPPVEIPYGAKVREALMIGVGGSDPMDYHALEAMQCMIERRRGGESGIRAVQMLEGDDVWKAGREGRWSDRLLEAALSRSDSLNGVSDLDSRPQDLAHNGELPKLVRNPSAYFIEHVDGLKTTLLMLNGALGDFDFAAELGDGRVVSTQFFLPPTPNVTYSARLMAQVEELIVTGKAPYPVERTQIASAMLDRCLDSKVQGHRRLETPELDIRYKAPRRS